MKRPASQLLTALLLMTGGVMAAGCGEQNNSLPPQPNAFASNASVAVAEWPRGPYERGPVDPNTKLDPETQGPEIKLLRPARGAQVTATEVQIEVTVDDPNGVSDVAIAGRPGVQFGAPNQYAALVQLHPGVNLLKVEARDGLGNTTTSSFSLVQGQFQAEDETLGSSVSMSLRNPALAKLATILDDLVKNLQLQSVVLAKNPLYEGSGVKVTGQSLLHAAPQAKIQGVPGGAQIQIDVDNLELRAQVRAIGIPVNVVMTADKVVTLANASFDPTRQNLPGRSAAGILLNSARVTFQNFKVRGGGLAGPIVRLLQGRVRDLVANKIEDLIRVEAIKLLSSNLTGIDTPYNVTIPIPGIGPTTIGAQMRLDGVDGLQSEGFAATLGMKLMAVAPVITGAPTSYWKSGATLRTVLSPTEDVTVFMTSGVANAALHAFWKSGVFRYSIDGSKPDPKATMELSARLMHPFLPPLKTVVPDPNTPLRLDLAVKSAPVVRFTASGLEITIGEGELKVFADYMDGKPILELFTLRIGMKLRAGATVKNRELQVTDLSIVELCADITNEPVADLADEEIEQFLVQVAPTYLAKMKGTIPTLPIPGLPRGLALDQPRIEIAKDVLVVRTNLK